MKKSLSRNKGEWSELLALYDALGKGSVSVCDPLTKDKIGEIEIRKAVREGGSTGLLSFELEDGDVRVLNGGYCLASLSQFDFSIAARRLKNTLNREKTSFTLSPDDAIFMDRIGIKEPKARSVGKQFENIVIGGKCDLLLNFADPLSPKGRWGSFSIKTAYDHPATLQNGSGATNFRYWLPGIKPGQVKEINSLFKDSTKKDGTKKIDLLKRCDVINKIMWPQPAGLSRKSEGSKVFAQNLDLIDTSMKDLLSKVLLIHYFGEEHLTEIKDFPTALAKRFPLQGREYDEGFYEKKLKDYLFACFSGMLPSIPWKGAVEYATGYLILDKMYNLSAWLSTDKERFRDYLFKSTKLEHPDSSKSRSNYGYIYVDEGRYYIDLNLQIRFSKE